MERETGKREDRKEERGEKESLLIGCLLSTLLVFHFFPSNRILCFVRDLQVGLYLVTEGMDVSSQRKPKPIQVQGAKTRALLFNG